MKDTAPTAVAQIRIFLCDDTPELRRRLRAQLAQIPGMLVVGEADDPVDGLPLIGDLQPDVVVLDLSMPRMDGLEAIEHVRACAPHSGIVIFSGFLSITMGPKALSLGADRYIEKSQPVAALAEALREVVTARRTGERPVGTRGRPAAGGTEAPATTAAGPAATPADPAAVRGVGEAAAPRRLLLGDALAPATVVLAAGALAAVLFALTLALDDPSLGIAQLLVAPVTIMAVRFGLHAGLASAALATVLTAVADALADASHGVAGSATRAAVFVVIAGVVGWFADRARENIRAGDAMNNELQRSNSELEQFAYIASHDLAEPLRTITGFTELFARRYSDSLDEQADRYIEHIINGTTRMQQLIDDLLAYSRVGRVEITPEPFELGGTLAQVCASLSGAIAEHRAEITHDELPTVFADPQQMSQVLQNLVGNAIKFQAPGEVPRIHVSAQRADAHWRIDVHDNGIGIDPRFTHRIFRMFQRLHAQHEYSGTGIGLAICQRIVERNGGRIWVDSQPGAGSTFSFTIPGVP